MSRLRKEIQTEVTINTCTISIASNICGMKLRPSSQLDRRQVPLGSVVALPVTHVPSGDSQHFAKHFASDICNSRPVAQHVVAAGVLLSAVAI